MPPIAIRAVFAAVLVALYVGLTTLCYYFSLFGMWYIGSLWVVVGVYLFISLPIAVLWVVCATDTFTE